MGRPTFFMFYTFDSVKKVGKNVIFLAFLDLKITKMAKKPFFLLKSGNFFWHTLIIWEDQHFSCNTLFDSVKKVGKNEIFLAFMGQKITKIAKKPFFIFKSGNFFGTP